MALEVYMILLARSICRTCHRIIYTSKATAGPPNAFEPHKHTSVTFPRPNKALCALFNSAFPHRFLEEPLLHRHSFAEMIDHFQSLASPIMLML